MINPARTAFFIPNELKAFKRRLFDRIADRIVEAGGKAIQGDPAALVRLPDTTIPIVGCSPYLRPLITEWRARRRPWIY